MLIILLCIAVVPVLGGYYLIRGKAKSLDRLKNQVDGDVAKRLDSIAEAVGGSVIDGPALEVLRGQMSLIASKAPSSMVIDVAKFSGKTVLPGSLTVVRVEDAKKVMATKNLKVLAEHPFSARYHVLVSDEVQERVWKSSGIAAALEALETGVRARCRLQVVHGTATIHAFRGMAKADELLAFCKGAIAVLDALDTPV